MVRPPADQEEFSMRLLSSLALIGAVSAFAIAPASACSWMKSAEADDQMTVVQTLPTTVEDVAVATNDLDIEAPASPALLLPVDGEGEAAEK